MNLISRVSAIAINYFCNRRPFFLELPWVAVLFQVGYTVGQMNAEQIIAEIEQLEEMFEAPDIRPLSASDVSAANRRHDETLAHSPWFRLWKDFGVCCRAESQRPRLEERDS